MPAREPARLVSLRHGPVEVREVGRGRPLLFLHGAFTDGTVWDAVAERLAPLGYRCVLPTLPLGSHRHPQRPGADLSPPGLADLVAELVDALGLAPATVVSNDTATAVMQLVLTRHPRAVAAAVLTSGDAYDHFLPPVFASLKALPYLPGSLRALAWVMNRPPLARQPWAFGRLSVRGMTPDQAHRWSHALRHDPGVRRDTRTLIRGFHRRHTLAAAERFAHVRVPVRVVWGRRDGVFPARLGERLARDLPRADLRLVDGASTYLQLDAPDVLADLVHAFAAEHAPPAAD